MMYSEWKKTDEAKTAMGRIIERQRLGRLYPSSKKELVEIARQSSHPVTVCPPGPAMGIGGVVDQIAHMYMRMK